MPDYEHGLVSVIRERVVLMALASEAQVDILCQQLATQAAFAPILRADAAKKMYERMASMFANLALKREMNLFLVPEEMSKKSRTMLQLLKHLEKTDFFDKLNKASDRVLKTMGLEPEKLNRRNEHV